MGLTINHGMDSIEGMWLALIPVSLLNQNFSVAKALFSDYIDEVGGQDADRAGAVGKLGMAVGFAFMFGPILATTLVHDYTQALLLSGLGTALAGLFLLLLPKPARPRQGDQWSSNVGSTPETNTATTNGGDEAAANGDDSKSSSGIMAFLRMPVLQTRGAQLLMAMRL